MKNNFLVAYSKNHTLTISHSKFFPCSTMLDLFRALSSSEFYFKMCLALKIAHHIDISPFVSNQLCFAPTRINHALLYSITETQPCLLLIWLLDDIVIIHVRTDNACTRHFRRHDHLLETLSFYPVSPKQKKNYLYTT